ncbi:hypothetical protein CSAL01_13176 [Colletotrichum salicis]|uniref:Uncharacterized protein n=1 Tax=Colletotrichum salicis TaxID=1209931 RepID=A0A135TFM5_9PEZI|nr:hypothetical protein CSAL01_13176 [Colletotrichum salicis]
MRRALGDDFAIFLASLTTPTERLPEEFEVEIWIARNRLYKRAQDRGQVADLRFERAGVFVLTLQAADEAVERSAGREGEASDGQNAGSDGKWVHIDAVPSAGLETCDSGTEKRSGVLVPVVLLIGQNPSQTSASNEAERGTGDYSGLCVYPVVVQPVPEIHLMSTFAHAGHPINVVRPGESRGALTSMADLRLAGLSPTQHGNVDLAKIPSHFVSLHRLSVES